MSVLGVGAAPAANALSVEFARTPWIDDARFRTRGRYPQLLGDSRALRKVNAALHEAMRAEQARYVHVVRLHGGPPGTDRGLFETLPRASRISASSVVVSALISLTELMPGGNADGRGPARGNAAECDGNTGRGRGIVR